jgi:prepilin-type N-terminal cleavage/methylation domain-containing protein
MSLPNISISNRYGFTLIELSIVLLIIGIITSGILVGQDLIRAAEIRATVSQYEAIDLAVNTFKIKFNCLPGDCTNAGGIGFDPTSSGNDDKLIGECTYSVDCQDSSLDSEYINFWYQLGEAGLIPYNFPVWSMIAVTDAGVVSPATKMTPAYAALGHYGWAAVADIRYQSTLSPDLTLEPHNFLWGPTPCQI